MKILHKEVRVIASPNIPLGYVGIPYRLLQQLQVEIGDLIPLNILHMGKFFVTWPARGEWEKAYEDFGYPQDGFIFLNEDMTGVAFDIHIDFKHFKPAEKPAPLIVDYEDLPKGSPVSFEAVNDLAAQLQKKPTPTEDSRAARSMIEAVVGKELAKDFDVEAWKDGRNYCVRAYYKPCIVTVSRSATLIGTVVTALIAALLPELAELRDEIGRLIDKIPDDADAVIGSIINTIGDSSPSSKQTTN